MDWRRLVAGGLYYSGLIRTLQALSRRGGLAAKPGTPVGRWQNRPTSKFVILCYHRVGEGGVPFLFSVAPELFEAQIRYLCRRYRIISLSQLCWELQHPGREAEQAVAITFDDGYLDLYTVAFPILQRYRVPAAAFLTVQSIETGDIAWYDKVFLALQNLPSASLELPFDPAWVLQLPNLEARYFAAIELVTHLRTLPDNRRREICAFLDRQVCLPDSETKNRMITWQQVREMQHAGITFGSHTMTHPVVSQLDFSQLHRELFDSKRLLEERLDAPVLDFAYPFGKEADCGVQAQHVLSELGYRSGLTTVWGRNQPGKSLYWLRRIQIGGEASLPLFALRLTQVFLQQYEDDLTEKDRGKGCATVGSIASSRQVED